MSLRSQAIAAHEAAQTGRESEARAALANVLAPYSPAALTVEHIEVTATYTLIVFTDGDIHLGVRSRDDGSWTVHVVAPAGGGVEGWTDLVEMTSLAQLGKVLPDVDPVDENAAPAVPAWTTGVAYKVGDKVTYGGFTWQCAQAHTSQAGWSPDAVPALWTKVAA